jgi:integrase
MINRDNWKLVRAYLKYRVEVDQISIESQRLEESRLRHLLEWADSKSFDSVQSIRPSFPEYILTARINGYEKLSPVYVKHIVRSSHAFFRWLILHRRGFSTISRAWLSTLKVPRMTIEPTEHEAVTLEEIRTIAFAPVQTIRERRARAAAVFLFLSGVRIGAFVTLPVSAIDLDTRTIKQWPKLGVKTKFGKHATTFMLDIPDLLEVVKDWDAEVRSLGCRLWFASVSPDTGKIDPTITTAGKHRGIRARKDIFDWLNRLGLEYHSPHKFRHGHAVYALKNAKDIPTLKAVSQNLMHANLSVTDGVYGILSDIDVKDKISTLGKNKPHNNKDLTELINIVIDSYNRKSNK